MRIRQEVYSYKKEICKILGSEWIRIRNIAHKNLLFFRLLHACISKVTNKEKTCFVCEWKFQFLAIFTRSKSKNSMPIPFPWSFWLDMRKCSTKQERLHIKKWKTYGNEITQIQDQRKTCNFTRNWREIGFRIQSFWISHLILNLIPRVSCLQNSFDDNEGLLCGQHYRESKGPEHINYQLTDNS